MDTNTEEMVPRSKLDAVYLERNMLACALAALKSEPGQQANESASAYAYRVARAALAQDRASQAGAPEGQAVACHHCGGSGRIGVGNCEIVECNTCFEAGRLTILQPATPAPVAGDAVAKLAGVRRYSFPYDGRAEDRTCRLTPNGRWVVFNDVIAALAQDRASQAGAPVDTSTNEAWVARAESKLAAKRKMEETQR